MQRLDRPSILDRHETLPDGEQHPLSELRDLIGDFRTLAFWAWVDEHGKRKDRSWRRQVYIPQPGMIHRLEKLVAAIGCDATHKVCEHFGGATLELPSPRWVMRRQAQRYAKILREEGFSPQDIAEQVTESGYCVSPYQVHAWLREGLGSIEDPEGEI